MPVVNREVVLPVPRERAWELVTEPGEMETWLAEDVEFEPEEGAPLRIDERHGVPRLTPGDVEPRSDDTIGAVFAALADPTRRQVVRSLSRQPELTASRLAGELPMTRQAVTKHLAALDRAGLVTARREGRETRYALTPAPLADAMRWMDDVGAEWDARLSRLAERR